MVMKILGGLNINLGLTFQHKLIILIMVIVIKLVTLKKKLLNTLVAYRELIQAKN